MKIQEARFKCNKCGKEFDGHIIVECSVKTFSVALKEEVCCPSGYHDFKKIALVRTEPA